jgi:anti-sigma-K factor RskA
VHDVTALQDLAEDFVLGLLDEADRADVERRLAAPEGAEDRALAVEVGAARDRLLPLDLTAPELPLAPDAWDRLRLALDAPEGEAPEAPLVATPVPGPAPVPAPDRPANRGAPSRGWRALAYGAIAASVVLAATLGWQVTRAVDPKALVVLVNDTGEAVAVLETFADHVVVTPLLGVEAGPTQVLQLWTKPDPDGPPVSLGVLQTVARMMVGTGDLPQTAAGQLYEITLEPQGGSPTGLPTGPVVGVGNAQLPAL